MVAKRNPLIHEVNKKTTKISRGRFNGESTKTKSFIVTRINVTKDIAKINRSSKRIKNDSLPIENISTLGETKKEMINKRTENLMLRKVTKIINRNNNVSKGSLQQ
jgi:hypothetical protein